MFGFKLLLREGDVKITKISDKDRFFLFLTLKKNDIYDEMEKDIGVFAHKHHAGGLYTALAGSCDDLQCASLRRHGPHSGL